MKKISILLFILIVSISAVFFINKFYPKLESEEQSISFMQMQLADIDHVVIDTKESDTSTQRSTSTVILENDISGWLVNGYVADLKEINALFDAIQTSRVVALVSQNDAYHTKYGVDDMNGYHVDFTLKDQTVLKVIVGNVVNQYSSYYLRYFGDKKVYHVDGRVRIKVMQDVLQWRDRMILDIRSSTIHSVSIQTFDGNIVKMVKKSSVDWVLDVIDTSVTTDTATFGLEVEKVASILEIFVNLKAHDFLSSDERATFLQAEDKMMVSVLSQDNSNLFDLLMYRDENTDIFWVQQVGKDVIYKVYEYIFQSLISLLSFEKDPASQDMISIPNDVDNNSLLNMTPKGLSDLLLDGVGSKSTGTIIPDRQSP